jgi:putative DNA primase/helicase
VWTGTHWGKDKTGCVYTLARSVVDDIRAGLEAAKTKYAQQSSDQTTRTVTDLASFYRQASSKRGIDAFIGLAQSMVPVLPSQFDQDPWLFNVANGTIDLRTGQLLPHSRDHLITRVAPVEYHPDAESPRFAKFLDEVFGGDQELVAYVQRFLGYCLTGDTSEQAIALWHGLGANGKSTLLGAVRGVMGEYSASCAPGILQATGASGNNTLDELARIRGARLVNASESGDGARLAEALIKRLTGDEPITAAFKYGHTFEY